MDATYKNIAKLVWDEAQPAHVLDVPAGRGHLSEELLSLGVKSVDCVDILPAEEFSLRDLATYWQADINKPLPMESESYDCVVSREGIEHLVTPFAFLRELCRLVKPDGYLVITTPNIMSVDSRLKFLVGGYFRGFRELRDNHDGLRSLEFQGHISPIYYGQLLYFLENAGLELVRLTTNERMRESKPLKRLIAHFMAGVVRRAAKRRGMYDTASHSDDLLFGDSLIVVARKVRAKRTFHGELF